MQVRPVTSVLPLNRTNRTLKHGRLTDNNPKDAFTTTSPSFKRLKWGGTIGGVVGTLAGLGAGVLISAVTGGAAVPLIAMATGCYGGGIAGDAIDRKISDDYEDDNTGYDHGDYYP